eukprot:4808658-Prymnesium_polylepis.1
MSFKLWPPRVEVRAMYKRAIVVTRKSSEDLGLDVAMEGLGVCKVTAVIAGSPAERAGLLEGDVIRSLDGNDVTVSLESLVKSKDKDGRTKKQL